MDKSALATRLPRVPAVRGLALVLTLGLGALAAGRAAAQQVRDDAAGTGRPLTVEDYYRLKTVGAPHLSPDARRVAYTVTTRVESTNGNLVSTWVVATDGTSPARRIVHDRQDVSDPSWLDDGRLRYRTGDRAWALDLDAPQATPASLPTPRPEGVPGPDGRWLASVRTVPGAPRPAAAVSDFERRHEERFRGLQFDWLNHKRDGRSAPVPDPRDPVATPAVEVFIAPADGGPATQLTRLGVEASDPQWAPDGSGLLFAADPDARDEHVYGGGELWFVSTDGRVRRLTDDEHVYGNAAFAPAGDRIAFTRSLGTDHVIREKLDHGGARDLLVIGWPIGMGNALDRAINLTAGWDLEPGAPMWSPDGRYIYFTAATGGESHLFRVPAAGGDVEQVTTGERRIAGVSIDPEFRRIAYTVGVYDAPPEIHVADIDGRNERRLTDVHADFLAGIATSRAERVRYASADGTPIEGWLILPYGYDPDGGPYPLIVSNHGGPHSAVGPGFDFKDQLFAAHGFFVLEVNFRGSTGYGDAFKWATWGAWGTKDGEDVIAGIDHVLQRWPIDPARVGTTGHSYGGFMTNWLITQYPDRFAAAVSGAGISNWISDYGMADIARTKETEFFGTPWQPEARDIMIRQSPLFYADRVRTPTLFVHGEVDYRVPYAEAEQFYFALRKNRVPAKIIQYEGQAHGISGHWNNVHRMISELRWWHTYLGVPRT